MWFSFFIYSVLTALLPGPNNILALNNTLQAGYKNTRYLLLGIYSGFSLVMLLSALISKVAVASFEPLLNYLKYFGMSYLLYLAWTVVKSKPITLNSAEKEAKTIKRKSDFWKGFFLQLINVKIIIYGITAFSNFVFPHFEGWTITLLFTIFLSLVGSTATWIWALAGQKLAHFLNRYSNLVNKVMALLLIYCAISLIM